MISLGYIGQLAGAVLFGLLSEIWGRKASFITALAIMGVFSLASALAWNFQSLALSRTLLGIGLGGEAPIAGAMIAELLQGDRRGRYFLFYQTLYQWGSLLTPLIGFLMISSLGPEAGWRALLGIGAVPLALAVIAYFLLPESVRWLVDKGRMREAGEILGRFEAEAARSGLVLLPPAPRARADTRPTRFGELFYRGYRRRTALCWLHWFSAYFVIGGLVAWIPSLFVRIGHLAPARSLLAAVGVNILTLFMAYLAARLIDNLGRPTVFAIGFAGTAIGALIGVAELGIFRVEGWLPLFVAVLVMEAFFILNAIGCYLYTAELYPTRMRAWGSSSGRAVSLVASIIAPLSTGALLAGPLGAAGMFGAFAAISLVGLAAMLWLGIETKGVTLEMLSQ